VDITLISFLILGIIAIASAIGTITSKNPVVSAMNLVLHFIMLSGLYFTLHAQFLGIMQILVYAGAIMVLVIFVIMLLNLDNDPGLYQRYSWGKITAIILSVIFVLKVGSVFLLTSGYLTTVPERSLQLGRVEGVGNVLFTEFLFPFEAITLLLIVAVIGALVLAKKNPVK